MDLTKLLSILKLLVSILIGYRELEHETQSDVPQTQPEVVPEEHGSPHTEQDKSA